MSKYDFDKTDFFVSILLKPKCLFWGTLEVQQYLQDIAIVLFKTYAFIITDIIDKSFNAVTIYFKISFPFGPNRIW